MPHNYRMATLRTLVADSGLRLQFLLERSGISKPTYYAYLSGKRSMTVSRAVDLAAVLHLPPADVLLAALETYLEFNHGKPHAVQPDARSDR